MEVLVWAQEPEYYDKNMFLAGAKFDEIVNLGKTIKDGLRTGNITCVVS